MEVSLWLSFIAISCSVCAVYFLTLYRVRKVEGALPFERMGEATRLREVLRPSAGPRVAS